MNWVGFRVVTLQREGAGKAMHTRSWHCHPRLSLVCPFLSGFVFAVIFMCIHTLLFGLAEPPAWQLEPFSAVATAV